MELDMIIMIMHPDFTFYNFPLSLGYEIKRSRHFSKMQEIY
jgi:hypothetical protein